jgi:LPS export ABC transporter protein LptC
MFLLRYLPTMNFYRPLILALLLLATCFGQAVAANGETLEDPILETTELEVIYSENGIVTAQVMAAKRLQYENGNTIFPEGIYGIFYDKDKNIVGTLSASRAYQYVDKNVYELKGDVEIKSYQDQTHNQTYRQLNTEELFWDLNKEEVYTDKFVRIESEEELLTGYGLFAKQDLSYYTISEPQGFAHIESISENQEKKE